MKIQLLLPFLMIMVCNCLHAQVCEDVYIKEIPVIDVDEEEGDRYIWFKNDVLVPGETEAVLYLPLQTFVGEGGPIVDYYRCYITNSLGDQLAYRSSCFMVHWDRWLNCGWIYIDMDQVTNAQEKAIKSTIKTHNINAICELSDANCNNSMVSGNVSGKDNTCLFNINNSWTCKRVSFKFEFIAAAKKDAIKKMLVKNRIPYQVAHIKCPSGNVTRAAKTQTNDPLPTAPNSSTEKQ